MKSAFRSLVQVLVERVAPARPEVGLDASDGQVHLRQPPGRVVQLLAVHGDVVPAPAMGLHEALGLDEHAARPAARVVDPALVGLDHLDQELDHRCGACRTHRRPCLRLEANRPRKYS